MVQTAPWVVLLLVMLFRLRWLNRRMLTSPGGPQCPGAAKALIQTHIERGQFLPQAGGFPVVFAGPRRVEKV